MGSHIGVGIALLALLTACSKSNDPPAPTSAVSASGAPAPSPALASHAVSSEGAFDLVATDDGALLVWGERDALLALALDARGNASGKPIDIAHSKRRFVEVSAASVNSRIGVAWIEADARAATAWGVLGDSSTRSFSPPAELGDASVGDWRQRGSLAVAASDRAEFIALRRGLDEPCAEDEHLTCATLGFRELLSTGPERRGLPLSVPAPCPRLLAGYSIIGDRWHYAVCSRRKGPPTTTQFNVQRKPFYAEAKDLEPGCEPLGMSVVGTRALTVFDCSDGKHAHANAGLSRPTARLDLARASLSCERGRPALRTPDNELVVELTEPTSGLAPLLPLGVAATGARAAWTGSALLVSSWVRQRVELRRFECKGSELARSD